MSGKKIAGIILIILGLVGAYYYIGGYIQCKNDVAIGFYDEAMSGFASMFGMSGVCDGILQQYWPMMAASVAAIILGAFLILKSDEQHNTSTNKTITPIQEPIATLLDFKGDKSLTNDAYKIYLVKKYGIEKNEALGKIICEGKLFDDIEQALQHAIEIEKIKTQQSNKSNAVNLTEVQKVLTINENINKKSIILSVEARDLGITHNGVKYCYKTYQYDQLDDALKFAQNDVQGASIDKQSQSPSSNTKLIVIVVGIIALIGGYFALQKNSSDPQPYKLTREKLIREGWRPITQTKQCSSECQKWRKAGWIETEACAPTGVVPCIFVFRNQNGNFLKVYTEGEGEPWVVNIENISSR